MIGIHDLIFLGVVYEKQKLTRPGGCWWEYKICHLILVVWHGNKVCMKESLYIYINRIHKHCIVIKRQPNMENIFHLCRCVVWCVNTPRNCGHMSDRLILPVDGDFSKKKQTSIPTTLLSGCLVASICYPDTFTHSDAYYICRQQSLSVTVNGEGSKPHSHANFQPDF